MTEYIGPRDPSGLAPQLLPGSPYAPLLWKQPQITTTDPVSLSPVAVLVARRRLQPLPPVRRSRSVFVPPQAVAPVVLPPVVVARRRLLPMLPLRRRGVPALPPSIVDAGQPGSWLPVQHRAPTRWPGRRARPIPVTPPTIGTCFVWGVGVWGLDFYCLEPPPFVQGVRRRLAWPRRLRYAPPPFVPPLAAAPPAWIPGQRRSLARPTQRRPRPAPPVVATDEPTPFSQRPRARTLGAPRHARLAWVPLASPTWLTTPGRPRPRAGPTRRARGLSPPFVQPVVVNPDFTAWTRRSRSFVPPKTRARTTPFPWQQPGTCLIWGSGQYGRDFYCAPAPGTGQQPASARRRWPWLRRRSSSWIPLSDLSPIVAPRRRSPLTGLVPRKARRVEPPVATADVPRFVQHARSRIGWTRRARNLPPPFPQPVSVNPAFTAWARRARASYPPKTRVRTAPVPWGQAPIAPNPDFTAWARRARAFSPPRTRARTTPVPWGQALAVTLPPWLSVARRSLPPRLGARRHPGAWTAVADATPPQVARRRILQPGPRRRPASAVAPIPGQLVPFSKRARGVMLARRQLRRALLPVPLQFIAPWVVPFHHGTLAWRYQLGRRTGRWRGWTPGQGQPLPPPTTLRFYVDDTEPQRSLATSRSSGVLDDTEPQRQLGSSEPQRNLSGDEPNQRPPTTVKGQ